MKFPDPAACKFHDGTFLIRPWRQGDADALHEAVTASITNVGRWLAWCHPGYRLAESEAWIETCLAAWSNASQYAFGIWTSDETQVLGSIGLDSLNTDCKSANLGYWIRSDVQNRGIATRACILIAAFASGLGFRHLEIAAQPDNLASRRVAEKSGARFAGTVPGRIRFQNADRDAALYVLALPEQNAI